MNGPATQSTTQSALAAAVLFALCLAGPSAAQTLRGDGHMEDAALPAQRPEALPVKLDVAIRGDQVVVHLRAPLDSLLGFAHQPRTVAQHQAGQALLAKLNAPQQLLRFDSAAQCVLNSSNVEAGALVQGQSAFAIVPADWPASTQAPHELRASYEFSCAQPERLATLDLALFDAFGGIQQVDVDVQGMRDELQQQLRRPQPGAYQAGPYVSDDAMTTWPGTRAWLVKTS